MRLPPVAPVLALLVGLLALDLAEPPAPRAAAPERTAAVIGATAVCPDLRQGGGQSTRISAGAATDATGPGVVMAGPLKGLAPPKPVAVARSGQVAAGLGAGVDGDALVVRATGPLAGGLAVEQVSRAASGRQRGLAGLRCPAPDSQAWFVGGDATVGDGSLLVLANPDDLPAIVDVTVWSDQGAVDPRPGLGLRVDPRSRAAIRLDELAPGRGLLAVRVLAQRGRVAAALRHARVAGLDPHGVDWVPQAQPPATTVVVPGLPEGPGRRVLLVTNPGPDPTVVRLELTGADRQDVPPGLDAIAVPGGTSVATDLTALTDRSPMTVTVTSDGGPVLAGAFVHDSQGRSPVKDFGYAGSAQPLDGPALLTDVVLDRPTESTLILTALRTDAQVRIRPIALTGRAEPAPAARTVTVRGGRTVAVRLSSLLPAGAAAQFAVEVRPLDGGGPVYAARYLRERGERGPLSTLLTLQSARPPVAVPAVRADPRLR